MALFKKYLSDLISSSPSSLLSRPATTCYYSTSYGQQGRRKKHRYTYITNDLVPEIPLRFNFLSLFSHPATTCLCLHYCLIKKLKQVLGISPTLPFRHNQVVKRSLFSPGKCFWKTAKTGVLRFGTTRAMRYVGSDCALVLSLLRRLTGRWWRWRRRGRGGILRSDERTRETITHLFPLPLVRPLVVEIDK